MTTCWNTNNSIILTKKNGTQLIINIGDCITHSLRDEPIRIDEFTGDKNQLIGMIYLTWKKTKWAEPRFTLRGNPRHIICVPDGMNHYGQHIDWNTIELVKNPENDFIKIEPIIKND